MTALLMTGFQNDTCAPDGRLAEGGKDMASITSLLPGAAALLETCRSAGIPIIHMKQRSLPNGMSDSDCWRDQCRRNGWPTTLAQADTWGEQAVEGFEPLEREMVVERFRSGALLDTRTGVLLRSMGASRLVVAGVETHQAVLATVIQAVSLDYFVVVPADCVASTDAESHKSALALLGSYAEVLNGEPTSENLGIRAGRSR